MRHGWRARVRRIRRSGGPVAAGVGRGLRHLPVGGRAAWRTADGDAAGGRARPSGGAWPAAAGAARCATASRCAPHERRRGARHGPTGGFRRTWTRGTPRRTGGTVRSATAGPSPGTRSTGRRSPGRGTGAVDGTPDDHQRPQPGDSPQDRRRAAARRALRRAAEECDASAGRRRSRPGSATALPRAPSSRTGRDRPRHADGAVPVRPLLQVRLRRGAARCYRGRRARQPPAYPPRRGPLLGRPPRRGIRAFPAPADRPAYRQS